jgi:DNA-binding IclR family transcriptional regulator
VRDHTGAVVAALSVSGPAYRFDRQLIGKVAPEVVSAAAAAISHRMGHLD